MYNNQTTTDTNSPKGFSDKHQNCGGLFSQMFRGRHGHPFYGKSPIGKAFGKHFGNRKAANIEENESSFKISLYAAGLIKSNFKISVTDDVLSIAYTVPQTETPNEKQFTHQEYEPASFERSFQLNGKVLTDSLSATYIDGVLVVTLPKNPETNKPAQEVEIN